MVTIAAKYAIRLFRTTSIMGPEIWQRLVQATERLTLDPHRIGASHQRLSVWRNDGGEEKVPPPPCWTWKKWEKLTVKARIVNLCSTLPLDLPGFWTVRQWHASNLHRSRRLWAQSKLCRQIESQPQILFRLFVLPILLCPSYFPYLTQCSVLVSCADKRL